MKVNHLHIASILLTGFTFRATAQLAFQHESLTNRWGIGAGTSVVPFIGGMSGPETPLSATRYYDTFDIGYGLRCEGYYDWSSHLRIVMGGVHNQWEGKYFAGGEFPNGVQFGDFSLTGGYIGARLCFLPASKLRPYLLSNIGIVNLSSVDVRTDSGTMPYWEDTWRDYFDIGVGAEYQINDRACVYLDVRLEAFGKPDSAQPNIATAGEFTIADATGGQCLPICLGVNYNF